ncbi:CvpA family protein [Fulvivirga sp. RKSG066]|uniref:CvpA family protein n=1 Tax=Fulvivirga aurantia TaxID=2529383 RepID=UPI0012BD366E|nr:CvpA family protein [Fulvivirga aurantia]MTI20260.1 CvpA family protein [Fulvivirga aurantia]
MSTIDIVLLIPLLFGAYKGFKKGFLLEVIAILAFILAIIGGFKLLHLAMDFLDQNFSIQGDLLPYIAFIAIFIAIILGVNLLGKALKRVIDLTLLGTVDNLAGLIISVLKWAFGLSVILWLTDSFGFNLPEEWLDGSLLYPIILPFAPTVVDYFSALIPFAHDLFDMIKSMLQGDSAA